eukprot:TRINITY_DN26477_c0_g1_i1.p1 TRINITY_DN26477_c0_g1~~TRINITY_DN26477_c0_g1_i1.p1  ORF type:complete len:231 (+),score=27.17 TRINITY_DN26477_c0_g1_i1:17-709(+)
MGKKNYYSVAVGRQVGIYTDWATCQSHVSGHPGAVYKGFTTMVEAQEWLRAMQQDAHGGREVSQEEPPAKHRRLSLEPPIPAEHGVARVYCDGACPSNGQQGARAGVGVWFGDGDQRNVSEPLIGKATNQRAELTAAIRALEAVPPGSHIEVYTDSMYTIKGITSWIQKWEKNKWRTVEGNDVLNADLWKPLRELAGRRFVKWVHVPGHSGVYGNEQADKLAVAGASSYA